MTGPQDDPAEIASELARLRASAAEEITRLQTALRESAAHAAQRDREVERLTDELQKAARPHLLRRPGGLRRGQLQSGRGEPDTAGAVERVLATFERERKQLEERARAVAATQARQRATEAGLVAEAARLAELKRQLRERNETKAALPATREQRSEFDASVAPSAEPPAPGTDPRELARREEEVARRELQLSLVRRRIGEEERRLQERAWRAGATQQRARSPLAARRSHDLTFSDGWRLLAGGEGVEPRDEGRGSW